MQIQPTLLAETISPRSNVSWKEPDTAAQVLPLSLPPLTTLLLADVDAGSNTPSMVSSVLKWRKSKPDEGQLWAIRSYSRADPDNAPDSGPHLVQFDKPKPRASPALSVFERSLEEESFNVRATDQQSLGFQRECSHFFGPFRGSGFTFNLATSAELKFDRRMLRNNAGGSDLHEGIPCPQYSPAFLVAPVTD